MPFCVPDMGGYFKNDLALNMATEQEMDYVGHQLNALFDQSQYNQNGWAVIRYSQDTNLNRNQSIVLSLLRIKTQ